MAICRGDRVWIHSYGKWRQGTVVKQGRLWHLVEYVANVKTGRVNRKFFRYDDIRSSHPEI